MKDTRYKIQDKRKKIKACLQQAGGMKKQNIKNENN